MTLLEQIAEECQSQLKLQGYVRWPTVAEKFGVSRQRIDQAIKLGVQRGQLPNETALLWRGSLLASTKQSYKISPQNLKYLTEQAASLNCHVDDFVNRLITHYRGNPTNDNNTSLNSNDRD